ESCGHEMPETSRVCLLCGRDAPAAQVELEPVEDPARASDGDRVVATAGGSRDLRVPLAVGAAIVVLIALVALLAGGDGESGDAEGGGDGRDDGSEEAATAPTTSHAPRATRPPTTRPSTTRPSTTTEPP